MKLVNSPLHFCPHCGRGMWMQDGWCCALCQPWVCRAGGGVPAAPSQQDAELWASSSLFWESGAAWEVDPGRVRLSRTRAPQTQRGAGRGEERGSCWGPSLRSPGSHARCPEAVQSQQQRAWALPKPLSLSGSPAAVSECFQMAPGSWHRLCCSIRGKAGGGQ